MIPALSGRFLKPLRFIPVNSHIENGVHRIAVILHPLAATFTLQNARAQIDPGVTQESLIFENLKWCAPVTGQREWNSKVSNSMESKAVQPPRLYQRIREQNRHFLSPVSFNYALRTPERTQASAELNDSLHCPSPEPRCLRRMAITCASA